MASLRQRCTTDALCHRMLTARERPLARMRHGAEISSSGKFLSSALLSRFRFWSCSWLSRRQNPFACQWRSGWTVVRSFLLVAMWVSYYLSLPDLSLSVAAAVYYTLPIFITLFSAAITGETIGRNGWLAVFIGFAGVLLILRPRPGDFNESALLPLLSAMLYALAMFLTRTRCRSENPTILALALNITFVVVGGTAALFIATLTDEARKGFLLAPWATIGLSEWISMGLLTAAILIGSVGGGDRLSERPFFDDRNVRFCLCRFCGSLGHHLLRRHT